MTAFRIEKAICWSVAYTVSVYGESGLFCGCALWADATPAPRKIVATTAVIRRPIESTSMSGTPDQQGTAHARGVPRIFAARAPVVARDGPGRVDRPRSPAH